MKSRPEVLSIHVHLGRFTANAIWKVALTALVISLFAPSAFAERPLTLDAATEQLRRLRADIEFLASEQLKGRDVADEANIDEAARYIAGRMQEVGLDITTIDGSAFQPVRINLGARAGLPQNNLVTLTHNDDAFEPIETSLGNQMNPIAVGSSTGQVSGPLVFVGYGITAPKLNYDDYKAVDVRGATVIVLRKEPQVSDPNSPFAGTRNTRHAYFATKIDNAIKHGAGAVILVNDPGSVLQAVQNERSKIRREQKRKETILEQIEKLPPEAVNNRKTLEGKLEGIDSMVASLQADLERAQQGVLGISEAGQRPSSKDSIPVVSVSRDIIDQALKQASGQTLEQLEKQIDDTLEPQSFPLPDTKVVLRVELKPTIAESDNVIGVLEGRGDLAEETVVVGAHYDHVGMGGVGSLAPGTIAVHNGADDNASGTATMLAIANRLTQELSEKESHRRVVCIAFTGEERGLLGSKQYVRMQRFPIASTAAMVNLDMVGRLRDNELTVYGTGSGNMLDEILEQANTRQQFNLFKVPSGYGPSDHQSFYEAGVPVLFFFTGLHNDYHRPSDDSDKIEFGGLTRITDIVSEVTLELAIRQERPKYAETENRVRIRRQMTAFIGVTLSDRGDHVVLSGVTSGGPADRAGLQAGDRFEMLADRRIRESSDVLEFMRSRSPGQDVKIRVRRNGKAIEKTVRLAPRPGG